MLIRLLSVYLLVSLVVFLMLVGVFLADSTTPKSDRLSWLLICIGSLFWVIAVPLSFVEVFQKWVCAVVLHKPESPRRNWN
ncbi:hypothetical protein [Leptolyngbya ohadii]|uniref:hypothetical protein n=1 Tax=Leptolyngbya ohadii TaxID=1962290 RepID=UPI000B59C703|nr:hypothetical protein [Leptolyngbya ohadii]